MAAADPHCPHTAQIRAGDAPEFFRAVELGLNIRERADEFLLVAVKFGREAIVRFLVGRGADVHARDDECVCLASAHGHEAIVRFLVDRGADVHVRNDYCVRVASYRGHEAVARFLVDRGANIHAHNDECLHWASLGDREAFVRFLVGRGADVRANDGVCVREASYRGRAALVRFLAERGADIHVNNEGCARVAASYGHLGVVRYLVAIGADVYAADKSRAMTTAISAFQHAAVIYFSSLGAGNWGGARMLIRRQYTDYKSCDTWSDATVNYLIRRGCLIGYVPADELELRTMKRLFENAQLRAAQISRAARRAYFWWVPLCFDPARRGGRRVRARNFREFQRLRACA